MRGTDSAPVESTISVVTKVRSVRRTAMVALVGFGLSSTVFVVTRQAKQDREQSRFERDARTNTRLVVDELRLRLEIIQSVKALYAATEVISREAFETFSKDALARHDRINNIHRMPRASLAERNAFEQASHADGFEDYTITVRTADDSLESAGIRSDYYRVHYIQPLAQQRGNIWARPRGQAESGEA
jgi:CHASE1-domain containing sensor protein